MFPQVVLELALEDEAAKEILGMSHFNGKIYMPLRKRRNGDENVRN